MFKTLYKRHCKLDGLLHWLLGGSTGQLQSSWQCSSGAWILYQNRRCPHE